MKRVFDIVISITSLVILTPFFLIISIFIKIVDNEPVFFRQKRIGRGGIPFYIFKFSTMRVPESSEEGLFGPGNSSNVTQLGSFLRRTKINELPQLINVLKGDMSVVGPRPEVEKWVAIYPERWAKVLRVKPGMTDNASLVYWNEEYLLNSSGDPEKAYRDIILPHKLDFYENYVETNSFSNDLKIIIATILAFWFKNNFLEIKLNGKYPSLDKV
jgi:lipopolysaccharide/colanic/teichoic acid biosynthesis glycosyltransferase